MRDCCVESPRWLLGNGELKCVHCFVFISQFRNDETKLAKWVGISPNPKKHMPFKNEMIDSQVPEDLDPYLKIMCFLCDTEIKREERYWHGLRSASFYCNDCYESKE